MARTKKILGIIYDNIVIIFNGSILFLLAFSGLLCAIFLRTLEFNGTIIASVGVLVEIIAIIILFCFFKRYFIKKEEKKVLSEQKGKKI